MSQDGWTDRQTDCHHRRPCGKVYHRSGRDTDINIIPSDISRKLKTFHDTAGASADSLFTLCCANVYDLPQWLTPVSDGWLFHRPSSTTSLRSFISYIGWKLQDGFNTSLSYCHGIAPNVPGRWTLLQLAGLIDPAYDQRRRHHCLSTVHGCQPSLIELFRLPLLAPWRFAAPCHVRAISAIFCSRRKTPNCSGVHFIDFSSACAAS